MARARYRSVAYDLEASLAVARAVADSGGDTTPAALAAALGYSGVNNGAFLSRMAAARLFGLVAGRSDRVLLSERGQAALAGGPAGTAARVAAFRSVPLFRAVVDALGEARLPEGRALADLLVREFGEPPAKSASAAAKLVDSAGQARLLQPAGGGAPRLVLPTEFTDHPSPPSNLFVPLVRYRMSPGLQRHLGQDRRPRRAQLQVLRRGGVRDMTDETGATPEIGSGEAADLWLDEGEVAAGGGRSGWRPSQIRRAGVAAAAVACLAVVGVPVGLALSSGGGQAALPPSHQHGHGDRLPQSPAEQQVLAALSTTTDAGNFQFTYLLGETRTSGNSGNCTSGGSGGRLCMQGDVGTKVTGNGTADTAPTALLATTSLGITVRADGTTVWEDAGTGLTPSATTGSGDSLPSFASLAEDTIGNDVGGVAMLAMASPTGFLDLDQAAVTGAEPFGSGGPKGTLENYVVSLDPTKLVTTPGITSQESATITAALAELRQQGMTGMTVTLEIDPSGYIHYAGYKVSFSTGDVVGLDTSLSDFGCAGTVLMPGQPGTPTPPAGCVSPDTGVAPATTPTTAPVATGTPSSTTSTAPTTTVQPSTTTTTTGAAGSTTTTTTS